MPWLSTECAFRSGPPSVSARNALAGENSVSSRRLRQVGALRANSSPS